MKKKIIQAIITALFFTVIFVACYEKKIELINSNVIVELGNAIDIQPEDLIDIEGIKSEEVHIDTSLVDGSQVGEYVGTINYKSQTLEFCVTVQDTTAPQIHLSATEVYLIPEQIFQISEIVERIEEVSGKVRLSSNEENLLCVNTYAVERNINDVSYNDIELSYATTTTAEEEFFITDEAQNILKFYVTFHVVNKPEIVVEDIQLTVEDEEALNKYLSEIKVIDDVDGEVYDNIQYNVTQIDINTEGEYKLLVSYENTKGISNEKEVTITVNKKPVKTSSEVPKIPIPEGCNPLVLQKVIVPYCELVPGSTWKYEQTEIVEYPADVDVRETEIAGRAWEREQGEWSNGEVTLRLACDDLYDTHKWDEYTNGIYLHARRILAYQELSVQGWTGTAYLLESGAVLKGAYYWYNPDVQTAAILPEMVFDDYGITEDAWIYY